MRREVRNILLLHIACCLFLCGCNDGTTGADGVDGAGFLSDLIRQLLAAYLT
jgi:hypothetical protein